MRDVKCRIAFKVASFLKDIGWQDRDANIYCGQKVLSFGGGVEIYGSQCIHLVHLE